MDRRSLLKLLTSVPAVAAGLVAMPVVEAAVPLVEGQVIDPWWNRKWAPFNPRLPDGSPGNPFILKFAWVHRGVCRQVVQVGGKVFVDGEELHFFSPAPPPIERTPGLPTANEFPGIYAAANEAWRIALAHSRVMLSDMEKISDVPTIFMGMAIRADLKLCK